ncbi:hypothetical protein GCM10023238_10760 [Streptomyces heliomycini]
MARGGVTTATDHHYVFPRDAGDLSAAVIGAARDLGVRLTLARGSMDRGEKDGGLPRTSPSRPSTTRSPPPRKRCAATTTPPPAP